MPSITTGHTLYTLSPSFTQSHLAFYIDLCVHLASLPSLNLISYMHFLRARCLRNVCVLTSSTGFPQLYSFCSWVKKHHYLTIKAYLSRLHIHIALSISTWYQVITSWIKIKVKTNLYGQEQLFNYFNECCYFSLILGSCGRNWTDNALLTLGNYNSFK